MDLARRLRDGDETFAVTGATGWFGRVTLDLLRDALGDRAFAQRVRAYSSRDFAQLAPAGVLLHFAYLTRDRVPGHGAAAFLAANLELTARVLHAAGDDGTLVYTSSGAAVAASEPYGVVKRADEALLAARPGTTVTARVFNVAGPHMTKPRLYALGDLVARAQAGEPLVVKAPRRVVRSYVAVADVVRVCLAQAVSGDGSVLFETAGEREVEVGELAAVVRRVLGREDLPIERPPLDPALGEDRYAGDGARMRALAERHGIALQPLEEQVAATAAGLPAA